MSTEEINKKTAETEEKRYSHLPVYRSEQTVHWAALQAPVHYRLKTAGWSPQCQQTGYYNTSVEDKMFIRVHSCNNDCLKTPKKSWFCDPDLTFSWRYMYMVLNCCCWTSFWLASFFMPCSISSAMCLGRMDNNNSSYMETESVETVCFTIFTNGKGNKLIVPTWILTGLKRFC